MAGSDEVYQFVATCPPNTAQAAPVTIGLAMPVRIVNSIRCRIPPGPAGVMGFALGSAGITVIPRQAGAFLSGDNEIFTLDLDGQIESGAWQVQMYNTSPSIPHSVYLTFQVSLPAASSSGVTQPVVVSSQPPATIAPIDLTDSALPAAPELT